MDEKLLESVGLSSREAKVYQAILKAKEIAPTELAKAVGVKRTTAYSIVRSLVEKGLAREDGTRRPRVFMPATPEELKGVVETEKKKSKERQELLLKLSDQVSLVNKESTYPVPRIRFIEEERMREYFYQAVPLWNQSMVDTNQYGFYGFQDSTYVEYFEDVLHWWWKIAPPKFEVYMLTNLTGGEKRMVGKYERRHMKYWGEATDFISSTWVTGDYVIMINTRQKPFYVIEIHSKLLAHDQREVFKNLWPLV